MRDRVMKKLEFNGNFYLSCRWFSQIQNEQLFCSYEFVWVNYQSHQNFLFRHRLQYILTLFNDSLILSVVNSIRRWRNNFIDVLDILINSFLKNISFCRYLIIFWAKIIGLLTLNIILFHFWRFFYFGIDLRLCMATIRHYFIFQMQFAHFGMSFFHFLRA